MTTPTLSAGLTGCAVLPPLDDNAPRPARTTTAPPKPRKGKSAGRATGDRFAVLNAFADFTLRELDRAEVAVWLLLWRDTKPDGLARTSQADLARRAGVSTRTVERAIASLIAANLLTVVHRGGLLRGASTYHVHGLKT